MLNPTPAKAVVRAYVEAMNSGDFASLTSLFAPEAVIRGVLGHGSLEVALPIWQ